MPPFDVVCGGTFQHFWAAYNVDLFYFAGCLEGDQQDDVAFDVCCFRDGRVNGSCSFGHFAQTTCALGDACARKG